MENPALAGPRELLSAQGCWGSRHQGRQRKSGLKESFCLSLHLQTWAAPRRPLPIPCSPTWLDSPSSLAGELEGEGSFQNVSVELQGEAWQLEIVSRLLGNWQPNNSGNGGGGEHSAGWPREADPQPSENFSSSLPVSVGVQAGDRNHISQLKRELTIKNW